MINNNKYTYIPSLFEGRNNNHIENYRYDVKELNGNYVEKYDEKVQYHEGVEKFRTGYSICAGDRDSNYDIMKDTQLDKVGRDFFSKKNIINLQNQIKSEVYLRTNGKIILDDIQDDTDLMIVMRAMYFQEGRFLPDEVMPIDYQVKKLNIKVINFLIPDLLTNLKQQYYYTKEINEPIKPLSPPVNCSIKGSKTNTMFIY